MCITDKPINKIYKNTRNVKTLMLNKFQNAAMIMKIKHQTNEIYI